MRSKTQVNERRTIQGITYLIKFDKIEQLWFGINVDEFLNDNDDCVSDFFDTKKELIDDLESGW